MLPHMGKEDNVKAKNSIEELEEMLAYENPDYIQVNEEELLHRAKKKLHEVLGFIGK